MCFHVDFGYELESHTPSEYANSYFLSLNQSEKQKLRQEMERILEKYPGKDQKGLMNEWFRVGAEWWDKKKFDLRIHLTKWIERL